MIHVTCRLTAKNRDQLWNPTLGNRVWDTFTILFKETAQQVSESGVNTDDVVSGARLVADWLMETTLQHSAHSAPTLYSRTLQTRPSAAAHQQ